MAVGCVGNTIAIIKLFKFNNYKSLSANATVLRFSEKQSVSYYKLQKLYAIFHVGFFLLEHHLDLLLL